MCEDCYEEMRCEICNRKEPNCLCVKRNYEPYTERGRKSMATKRLNYIMGKAKPK